MQVLVALPLTFVSSARSYNVFAGLRGLSAFTLLSKKNCLRNSLCMHGWCGIGPSAVKSWVGLRDGGTLLAIANLPLTGRPLSVADPYGLDGGPLHVDSNAWR